MFYCVYVLVMPMFLLMAFRRYFMIGDNRDNENKKIIKIYMFIEQEGVLDSQYMSPRLKSVAFLKEKIRERIKGNKLKKIN